MIPWTVVELLQPVMASSRVAALGPSLQGRAAVALATVICVSGLVLADPAQRTPRQTAAGQQGGAVLFYAAHQGQMTDILFRRILFNQVLVNQGSAYSNATGVFTAPVAGVYQFVFAAQLCRGDHDNRWFFMVNGGRKMLCHAQVYGGTTTLNTCYFMAELQTGDEVWVRQEAGSCAWSSATSTTITFSGVLLAGEGVSTLQEKFGPGAPCPLPRVGHTTPKSRCAGPGVAVTTVVLALLLRSFLL